MQLLRIALPLACGLALAQDTPKVKSVPIPQTSAANGAEMFVTYCAACHGKNGRGDGPAAASLKNAPTDLTQLAKRNGGVFPEQQVKLSISGASAVPAHGSREMPVWGRLFESLAPNASTVNIRINTLTAYIKSMQQK